MSTPRYPIRKSGVCGFIRQNVSIASSDGVLSGPVSDSVACYSGKLKIVPIFGGGIFHHSTLRRIGSVLPGLPVRVVGQELFGDDRIGTSIGLTVGCGRCSPMRERMEAAYFRKRFVCRLAGNWRSVAPAFFRYMELADSAAAERPGQSGRPGPHDPSAGRSSRNSYETGEGSFLCDTVRKDPPLSSDCHLPLIRSG